jgi:hypothetical protein
MHIFQLLQGAPAPRTPGFFCGVYLRGLPPPEPLAPTKAATPRIGVVVLSDTKTREKYA